MNKRDFSIRARFGTVIGMSAAIALFNGVAAGADISADSLKLAPDIVKAAEGYETPPTTYIVANSTSIYSGHSLYDTKVTGELKRGDHVEVLRLGMGAGGQKRDWYRVCLDVDAVARRQLRSVNKVA